MDFYECKYEMMSNKRYTSRQNNVIKHLPFLRQVQIGGMYQYNDDISRCLILIYVLIIPQYKGNTGRIEINMDRLRTYKYYIDLIEFIIFLIFKFTISSFIELKRYFLLFLNRFPEKCHTTNFFLEEMLWILQLIVSQKEE